MLNTKRGILIGLVFASFYSLYVLILYAVRGSEPFAVHHTSLLSVLGAYILGGIVGGALVGTLQPFVRNLFGAIAVGIVAAFFISVGITTANEGPIGQWTSDDWLAIGIMAVFFGSIAGTYFWKSWRI